VHVATQQAIAIPAQVVSYLRLHHILTLGTSSFTGMPQAATTAYASGTTAVYFSVYPDQLTIRNIEANHWASFTIDDYTPDFRKVRELRGVGRCAPVDDPEEQASAVALFAEKLPNLPPEALANMQRITPLELPFVDFEYTAGVAVPQESNLVYEAAPETGNAVSAAISTQLENLVLEPGEVIVRQGERSDRFFIIVDGEVEVRREGHGQDVVVTRHGAGQLFGEVGALTGAPQEASFVAIRPTTVLAIHRRSFEDFATQSAGADLRRRVRDTLIDLRRDAPSASPPSGWYPDPSQPEKQRYWDGNRWTDHLRDAAHLP
jgi:nitroimidazol reductase NimA-like FMN-containing flavoprotein (pyridoxamine 5'-phosphate oxidase superfamily)